jgi:chromate reductase, NAD(P)H dehydrogenase (quinone)
MEQIMSAKKVAVVVGSIRRDSINRKLALALMKLAPKELQTEILRIDDLPVYNQDLDENSPEPARRLKAEVAAAEAFLFVTPEHNRSIPAAMKNALDWASRPYGQNRWAGKPGGIIGASPGQIGTAVAQHTLRGILGYLDVPTLGQPEAYLHFTEGLIDADGTITNEGTRKFLQGYMDRYAKWVSGF